jgi:hypothetical protein
MAAVCSNRTATAGRCSVHSAHVQMFLWCPTPLVFLLQLEAAGRLPRDDTDPRKLCDRLSQLALASGDDAGLAAAQAPWSAATTPGEAKRALEEILVARPDLRPTGEFLRVGLGF